MASISNAVYIVLYSVASRWTSYPLSRTGWLRPRHALASRDEGMELVSMKEGSGLRHRWCAVVWVKENLPLQQHTGDPKQPVGDTEGTPIGVATRPQGRVA